MQPKDMSSTQKYLLFASPIPPGGITHRTHRVLSQQAHKLVKQVDRHELFLNKVTYSLGVLSFGLFCYLLGSSPQDIPHLYCLFFIFVVPLRWMYYRIKKWHYYLLDFCYYANVIFVSMLLFFPNNSKLFMLCFSFSEGPLAWALIVWRCSLVFSSIDKIISVLIHLLPGTVFFILRWWDSNFLSAEVVEENGPFRAWPVVNSIPILWMWLFFVPLMVYCIWQALYFLVVEGLRRQRILQDPEIMTSYRELRRKAKRANNIWWHLSGLLGDENRVYMYAILQAVFTIATLAFTVPMFKCYRLHIGFEVFKLAATVWNGGNFVFDVMPRKAACKKMKNEIEIEASKHELSIAEAHQGSEHISTNIVNVDSTDQCSNKLMLDNVEAKQELEMCRRCRMQSNGSQSFAVDDYRGMNGEKENASRLIQLMFGNRKGTLGRGRRHGPSSERAVDWRQQVACAG